MLLTNLFTLPSLFAYFILLSLTGSSLLQPLILIIFQIYIYNLHNFIATLYPLSLYIPLYSTKYIHLLYHIQINASYIFSFSHLFLSITNLIILGWFSFPSLLIPFNDRLSLHSFLDSKQSDSHYLVIDSIVLNFPEGTSSSYQPLIFYSYASLSSNNYLHFSSFSFSSSTLIHTMSLSEPCLIHILGHHYHPTYQLQMLPFSHKLPLLRVYASFHQKLTLLFSNRNTGLVHHLSTNHSTLGPLGNESETLWYRHYLPSRASN